MTTTASLKLPPFVERMLNSGKAYRYTQDMTDTVLHIFEIDYDGNVIEADYPVNNPESATGEKHDILGAGAYIHWLGKPEDHMTLAFDVTDAIRGQIKEYASANGAQHVLKMKLKVYDRPAKNDPNSPDVAYVALEPDGDVIEVQIVPSSTNSWIGAFQISNDIISDPDRYRLTCEFKGSEQTQQSWIYRTSPTANNSYDFGIPNK